jgi:hypothetical protein
MHSIRISKVVREWLIDDQGWKVYPLSSKDHLSFSLKWEKINYKNQIWRTQNFTLNIRTTNNTVKKKLENISENGVISTVCKTSSTKSENW